MFGTSTIPVSPHHDMSSNRLNISLEASREDSMSGAVVFIEDTTIPSVDCSPRGVWDAGVFICGEPVEKGSRPCGVSIRGVGPDDESVSGLALPRRLVANVSSMELNDRVDSAADSAAATFWASKASKHTIAVCIDLLAVGVNGQIGWASAKPMLESAASHV